MNRLLIAFFAVAMLALVGCASPQARAALEQLLADGKITQGQFDALVGALGGDWSFLREAAETVAAIAGSLIGVRLWRGSTTARHGLAEAIEKVLPPPSVRATTVAADAVAAGKAVP